MPSPPSPITFKSGLYWQRKPILGFWAEPVALTLGGGMLTLTSRTDTVFQAPVAEVAAKFSKMGSMSLTVAGVRYPIIFQGGTLAPKFTSAQLQEIAEADRAAEAAAQASTSGESGDAAGDGGFVVAGKTMPSMGTAFGQLKAVKLSSKNWRDILAANGVTVTNP